MGALKKRTEAVLGDFTTQSINDVRSACNTFGFNSLQGLVTKLCLKQEKIKAQLSDYVAASSVHDLDRDVPAATCD